MKTCAICHAENDATAPSCVACGEATWLPGEPDTVRRPAADTAPDEGSARRSPPRPKPETAASKAVQEIRSRRGAREPS